MHIIRLFSAWAAKAVKLVFFMCIFFCSEISMPKPRYKVDLKAYMALSEANYFKAMKLISLDRDYTEYAVELPNRAQALVKLTITQRCKYTTMVTLEKDLLSPWLVDLVFDVRLYHDARGLEITRFQRQKTAKIRYTYPNDAMFQQDEKMQQQVFLAECLSYCLQYGLSDVKLGKF
ncbi:MAG: DUF1249 domain-containing protein [Pseudomonadales bacterium]|nr:DUF1249 domain-containing protein [Pseudomonadales bacterium]